MSETTTPNLEERFLEPPGWQWGSFKNEHNKTLRFGSLYPESPTPDAIVVILPGRTEFIEKYFEIARDLSAKNMVLWVIDWQGQGQSWRFPTYSQRGHSPNFDEHVADLNQFMADHVKAAATAADKITGQHVPLIMLAQSMGGNIGMRYLQTHPDIFDAAALCAPMLGLKILEKLPLWFSVILAKTLCLLKGEHSYAFGQTDWEVSERKNQSASFSNDPKRNAVHNAWFELNPALRTGGVTFGWLLAALKSCQRIQSGKHVDIPCLLAMAGKEELVDNNAIQKVKRLMKHGKLLDIPASAHEILMETDATRETFLKNFYEMVTEIVKDRV